MYDLHIYSLKINHITDFTEEEKGIIDFNHILNEFVNNWPIIRILYKFLFFPPSHVYSLLVIPEIPLNINFYENS